MEGRVYTEWVTFSIRLEMLVNSNNRDYNYTLLVEGAGRGEGIEVHGCLVRICCADAKQSVIITWRC